MNSPEMTFVLPLGVVGRSEVNRLYRELELLDNFLKQDAVRQPGAQAKMPTTTRMMDEFCKANDMNLLINEQRKTMQKYLKYLTKSAPVMHVSFAVEAPPTFISKMLVWIRENIHPHALLQIGLAPSIIAGCIVRTTNKVFNFGLKQRFDENKSILVEQIRTLG